MRTLVIFSVLLAACWMLPHPASRWHHSRAAQHPGSNGPRASEGAAAPPAAGGKGLDRAAVRRLSGRTRARPSAEDSDMVRLVRELAALLGAGRSGAQLWEDAAAARAEQAATAANTPENREAAGGFALSQLQAAHRASVMGLSASATLRSGCRAAEASGTRSARLKPWRGLAACLDVAETSGAPLASVLHRFAAQLESEIDAEALRQTALAGPKATVRLLTWLPVLGLLLGTAMGVDPAAVLIGRPLGWVCMLAGGVLTLAGRMWSRALILAAAGS